MGVNKVDYNGETLIDLTGDTVTPATLAEGATAHDMAGNPITGTMKQGSGGASNTFTFDFALSFDTGDMVIALPSTVTSAELVEKFNAGVHVVGYLKIPSYVPTVGGTHALPMTSANIDAVFTALLGYTDLIITVKQDGSASYNMRLPTYTIDENSTDDQKPSAKAVYDFVNSNSGGDSANSPLVLEMVNVDGDYLELPEGVTYNDIVNAYNAGRQVIARVTSLSGNCKMSLNLFAIVPRYADNLASMCLWFTAFCQELYGTFVIYNNGEIDLMDDIEIIMNM